jgi:hypothetical protein
MSDFKYLPDPTVHHLWRRVRVLANDGSVAVVRSVRPDAGGRREDFTVMASLLKDDPPRRRSWDHLKSEDAE